jgi:hypothetical protein
MAATFAQVEAAITEVVARINNNRTRLETAKANIGVAETDLASMPAQYGTIFADLDAAAAASPGNAALASTKARKDLLVAEFVALNARATALAGAVQGL